MFNVFILVVILVSLVSGPSLPVIAQPDDSAQSGKVDRVLVLKSDRRLYLIKDNRVLRSYAIALGRSPVGHKVFEGDGRTPEGIYVLDRKNGTSRFHRSIHISYPSAADVAEAEVYGGRPGGLVMIHGQPSDVSNVSNGYNDGQPRDWTEGCIAVSNAEMDEIWSVTDEGTPIEILP